MSSLSDMLTLESSKYASKYADTLTDVKGFLDKEYGDKFKISEEAFTYSIGKYADTVEAYLPILENDVTNVGNLGDVLKQSLGLVASQYATSIIPFIGATQPADQELAIIYYKRATATMTRGGINAGDEIQSRFGKVNDKIDDYTSDTQTASFSFDAANNSGVGPYVINSLGQIRPGTLNLNFAGKIRAIDNGEGNVFGAHIDPDASSVNYETGVVTIKLTSVGALVAGDKADLVYTQLLMGEEAIPGFKYDLKSEAIPVKYWPMQVTYDAIADFVAKKKFGSALSDLAYKDLVYQINKIVSFNAIKQLRAAAIQNEVTIGASLSWDKDAPAGVSLIEHRRTFEDIYNMAIGAMETIAGTGGVSAIITGGEGRKIFRSLGIESKVARPGAYIIGFQDGIPVIYAPKELLPENEVLIIYKGDEWFQVPLVYAPFMPVMTATMQGRNQNVFLRSQGIAHGAGLKVVNGGFVQRVILN